jgi:pilus assembly protein CpaE
VTKVLLTSRNAVSLRPLQQSLEQQSEFDCQVKVITNGHTDPLYGLAQTPDIVVLRFDAENTAELVAWSKDSAGRPPLIVVGPAGQGEAMRLAIRSGAKDFLPEPVGAADLVAALRQVHRAMRDAAQPSTGELHAVVGAAGGVGTSFVAVNTARILCDGAGQIESRPPMLVDLDLNFAPLAHHLDLRSERGVLQALEAIDSLDEVALSGFGARHRSGLRLLSAIGGPAVLSKDISAEKLATLLRLLTASHPHVVVDVPHVLDNLTATVFSVATNVLLVLQQSVLHVRNGARLVQILKTELGVNPERIRVVVNRYRKDALVQSDDICRGLGVDSIVTVPSHYRSALESIDTGVPLFEIDRRSAVVRPLSQFVDSLTGADLSAQTGLLQRVLPNFLRK